MSYYRGAVGDYYSGRGDFWSKAKKAAKKAFKVVSTVAPSLGGGFTDINKMQGQLLMNAASSLLPGGIPSGAVDLYKGYQQIAGPVGGMLPVPSIGNLGAIVAGRGAAYDYGAGPGTGPVVVAAPGRGGTRRRSMNAANIHALRRALRRVDSFRNIAKKSGAMPAVKRFPAQRGDKCCK